MRPPVTIPEQGNFRLANVRLHRTSCALPGLAFDEDGLACADLVVAGGQIATIEPAGPVACEGAANVVDGRGGILLPAFIDCHTHLDKGHIWPRNRNPDGSFSGALDAAIADQQANWSAGDIAARMDFSLRCAYAHGTAAIRSHLDSQSPQENISWPVFVQMRERWKGRIDLQAACLFGIEAARHTDWFDKLASMVAQAGGVMGAVAYMVDDLDTLLDRMFAKAAELGLDLDFHADETGDQASISLDRIARAALRHDFGGRVLVGHCCSLSRQPDATVLETLDLVARANLSIVSLPLCNMYLQDRRANGTTPRWRGVTLLHEMAARGINVAVASDNTRDPFYAYGDLDMLEIYREATRILHFDHPVGNWPASVGSNAADALGLSEAGRLKVGGSADFILFRGRSFTELLSRPESERTVIRGGRILACELPDYCELDDLMEV